MLKLYVIAGAVIAALVSGIWIGKEWEQGQQAQDEVLIAQVQEAAQKGAAEEIAKIEVKNTTIRQKVEVQTREVPVYSDCRNTPDVQRLLDDALTNGGADSSGGGVVSGTDPAG